MKILNKKSELDLNRIPKHIALIMDGNGRWAKKRGLPRYKGHEEGAKRIFDVARKANELGVEIITLYAFSTENWKRPKEEVDYIFSLLKKALTSYKEKFSKENYRVNFIGLIDEVDQECKELMYQTMEETRNNKGLTINIAINYGGRSEILEMVKSISTDCLQGKLSVNNINESTIENYLMTRDMAPVDLMVRTSGEVRISNFLLWQIAYSELIFDPTPWPSFDGDKLEEVLIEYQSRDRRFGGIK